VRRVKDVHRTALLATDEYHGKAKKFRTVALREETGSNNK
jgi:hypothetical protein